MLRCTSRDVLRCMQAETCLGKETIGLTECGSRLPAQRARQCGVLRTAPPHRGSRRKRRPARCCAAQVDATPIGARADRSASPSRSFAQLRRVEGEYASPFGARADHLLSCEQRRAQVQAGTCSGKCDTFRRASRSFAQLRVCVTFRRASRSFAQLRAETCSGASRDVLR